MHRIARDILKNLHYLWMMDIRKLHIEPIGIISTHFTSKYSTPRQPATAPRKTVGTIRLFPRRNFEQALQDLQGFDYIWVIFWFHENLNWKPMVLPPHGGRKKRGVFSTRSPHRPNPIGLSLCKLIDIKGRTIRIENPDMLDGTPVLDIKPYLPHAESHPDARSGWIGESNEQSPRPYKIVIAPEVRSSLKLVEREERQEIVGYLKDILTRDPHPHIYRRIKAAPDGTSVIAVKRWRFMFSLEEGIVRVFGVAHDKDRGNRP